MAYFPMQYSMKDKKVLIIGAGEVANNKLEKLLEFTNDITIVAQDISNEILKKQNIINIIDRKYKKGDISKYNIVVVAVNDLDLQKDIYFECKEQNILCNCVDLKDCSDFIFPSYIKEEEYTIAISTNGSSPAFSKRFKKYIKKMIPKDINSFIKNMKELRQSLPKGKKRMKLLDEKVKEYFEQCN